MSAQVNGLLTGVPTSGYYIRKAVTQPLKLFPNLESWIWKRHRSLYSLNIRNRAHAVLFFSSSFSEVSPLSTFSTISQPPVTFNHGTSTRCQWSLFMWQMWGTVTSQAHQGWQLPWTSLHSCKCVYNHLLGFFFLQWLCIWTAISCTCSFWWIDRERSWLHIG